MDIVNSQLAEINKELDTKLEKVAKQFQEMKMQRSYVDYDQYILSKLKKELALSLSKLNIPTTLKIKLEKPPEHLSHHLAVPVFEFSKIAKKSPEGLAQELVKVINSSDNHIIESAEAFGGYVNIFLKKEYFFDVVIKNISELTDNYGQSDIYKDKSVFIDYSSPNIAKPLGVGHLRSTVIGEALARIYSSLGYSVIRDNHLGDWGAQFGSLIYAYKKWGDKKVLESDPINELKNLYVRFTSEAEKDPTIKDEARKIFVELEKGDEELMKLWVEFKDLSLKEFEKTYDELGIKFDIAVGESYYVNGGDSIVDLLVSKNLAHKNEEGAVVVDSLQGVPSFLLKKSDGSSLYILRDILAILHRQKVFDPNVILYIVGSEQDLNFKQLFLLCKNAGIAQNVELKHIGFGLVMVDGKKMGTRKGTAINLNDVIDQITDKARIVIKEKGEVDPSDIDKVARKIGLSAIVYNDLRQNRLSNIEFDWEKMLSLESGSVVYLQYTYARILSILKNADFMTKKNISEAKLVFQEKIEFELALKMSLFPEVLLKSIENDTPHLVCDFLDEIASQANRFYSEVAVLNTIDQVLKNSRLTLLSALAQTIRNAMNILNLPIVERL